MVSPGENTSRRTSKDYGELVTDCQNFQVLSPDLRKKKNSSLYLWGQCVSLLFSSRTSMKATQNTQRNCRPRTERNFLVLMVTRLCCPNAKVATRSLPCTPAHSMNTANKTITKRSIFPRDLLQSHPCSFPIVSLRR